jgi:hypothetical protein
MILRVAAAISIFNQFNALQPKSTNLVDFQWPLGAGKHNGRPQLRTPIGILVLRGLYFMLYDEEPANFSSAAACAAASRAVSRRYGEQDT